MEHSVRLIWLSAVYNSKLPIFYGEEGKGEVSWDAFKYEISTLASGGYYKEEQILLGIRRSFKGKAGDSIRRLGTGATIEDIIDKFESDYGSVESKESIMKKFYGCHQKHEESVASFATRLEDIYDQAVAMKALKKSDHILLKEVLHAGLKKELKHLSFYHCDKIVKYDDFKRELRRLEASLNECPEKNVSACKAETHADSQSSEDMNELKDLIRQLNERIDRLEYGKEEQQTSQSFGGYGRGRGYRGRGYRGRGDKGRGRYQQQWPLANRTFQPTCFQCLEKGHKQWECPTLNNFVKKDVACFKCKQIGHKAAQCPN